MNPDLIHLRDLETVDTKIRSLQAEIAALPKRVAEIEAKLRDVKAQVEQQRKAVESYEKQRRALEDEIRTQQGKIAKYREQSLAVKTNEQYKALMTEIEFAETAIRKSEDSILEGMLGIETAQGQLKQAEAEAKRQADAVELEKEQARVRTVEDEVQLREAQERRAQLRAQISEEALSVYDRVARHRGNALAEAREQRCSACFVLLRPQKYNEVRSTDQLHTCDSCGRILFYNPASEAAPAGAPHA